MCIRDRLIPSAICLMSQRCVAIVFLVVDSLCTSAGMNDVMFGRGGKEEALQCRPRTTDMLTRFQSRVLLSLTLESYSSLSVSLSLSLGVCVMRCLYFLFTKVIQTIILVRSNGIVNTFEQTLENACSAWQLLMLFLLSCLNTFPPNRKP